MIYSLIQRKCVGYRAPSYSLDQSTSWALDILESQGYIYDASIFPIKTPLYGVTGAPLIPYRPSHTDITKIDKNRRFLEFPALVRDLKFLKIPAAGGFFLRLLPLKIIENAIESMNHSGYPAVIAVHPWEIDNNTPRLKLGLTKSFVTYHNLENMIKKFEKLLSKYKFSSFSSYVENYLKI